MKTKKDTHLWCLDRNKTYKVLEQRAKGNEVEAVQFEVRASIINDLNIHISQSRRSKYSRGPISAENV